ncbi:helix-turn-helix domain-containing protein [Mycobacterium paraterrae]|uniref:Helix-turn-helix domain-containing protein n=1 Tax=Mycobacterium paraterrae TaxID=577492 RepID=A0ABY3VEM0_9MYCO|nr:helix-turn-helix domain-containing protein [Mycobacterium paraterrae]UMB67887.1 helix-turn-helix domain-containing protein [Mycobacterium paraterrae]
MSLVLNTDDVAPADRGDYFREALAATMVSVECHWRADDPAATAHGVITSLGDLTVCCGGTTAVRVERTPTLARDDREPSVFVNLQLSGSSMVVQSGREAVLRPGGLVIYDSTMPYTLLNAHGMAGEFFQIPLAALALPHDAVRRACAVSLLPGHPLTALTHDHLRRLAAHTSQLAALGNDGASHPSIELIRAVLATHLQAGHLAKDALADTLAVRIMEYARHHLDDADLNAATIAAAHHISVRHLYQVLAAEGVSLADWIRMHRLEACRRALVHDSGRLNIAGIARRYGFTNMSSFSRAFRIEYGLSPREWRRHSERQTSTRREVDGSRPE